MIPRTRSIYNRYGAARGDEAKQIDVICGRLVEEVLALPQLHDVPLHEIEHVIITAVGARFASARMQHGMSLKAKENGMIPK